MPQKNIAVIDFLHSRRSRPAKTLTLPVPDREEIIQLLTAAARTPDHGKLEPWRFIVLNKTALSKLANLAEKCALNENLDEDTVEIKSIKYGEFAKIPRYLESWIEWGEIDISNERVRNLQKVQIYGKIILSTREVGSEENHIKWGLTTMNYWYVTH